MTEATGRSARAYARLDTLDGWGELVLDRHDRRNALTPDMLTAMAALIERHAARHAPLLLRGEGRCLCAGFDLSLCKGGNGDAILDALLVGLDAVVRAMRAHAQPVVVCAHGAAIAGGCALLGGGDVVVTNKDAKLGYPVITLGISPAVSIPFMRLAAGDGVARERTLDPKVITAAEAHAAGLTHECLDTPEEALVRTRAIAAEFAAKPPGALAATKRYLNEITGPVTHAGIDTSRELVGSAEQRELLPRAWTR